MVIFLSLLFIILCVLASSIFVVKQQTSVIIERFGKFNSYRNAGINFKLPLIDKIAGKVNLKIQQLDVMIETKTKDNVFVHLKVSVQYQVVQTAVYDAFYNYKIHMSKLHLMFLMWFVQRFPNYV